MNATDIFTLCFLLAWVYFMYKFVTAYIIKYKIIKQYEKNDNNQQSAIHYHSVIYKIHPPQASMPNMCEGITEIAHNALSKQKVHPQNN